MTSYHLPKLGWAALPSICGGVASWPGAKRKRKKGKEKIGHNLDWGLGVWRGGGGYVVDFNKDSKLLRGSAKMLRFIEWMLDLTALPSFGTGLAISLWVFSFEIKNF